MLSDYAIVLSISYFLFCDLDGLPPIDCEKTFSEIF